MLSVNKTPLIKIIGEIFKNQDVIELIGFNNANLMLDNLDREDAFPYINQLASKLNRYIRSRLGIELYHLNLYELADLQYDIRLDVEKLKVFLFKQRKILLAVPQRKRHAQYPAPNLGGFHVSQNYRIKGEVSYGLDYCAARTFLVDRALEDPEITDILFVDDDILMPLDAISILGDTFEPIVGANYIKKRFPEETVALAIHESNGIIHNKEVRPEQGNMQPIEVSQMGLGCTLISVEVFKKIPRDKWFGFIFNKDGSVYRGEDVQFCQEAILAGFKPKIIPGLVPVHVDFQTNKYWGPDWLVHNHELKEEFKEKYCHMLCDVKELIAKDIKDVFNKEQKK